MSLDGIDSVVENRDLFMCQITSLFLLQRLKESMPGDARDFNNIETRAVIFFLQAKAPKEIHAILTETIGEYAPSYATVTNWVAQFKRGDFSTCDEPRPGRPKTVIILVIFYQIHELILVDRRILAKSIAEHLTWASWVHHSWGFGHAEALREVGLKIPQYRWKTSTVPVVCATFGTFSAMRDPNDFLSRLVTMDETWLYHYDQKVKQQSMEFH